MNPTMKWLLDGRVLYWKLSGNVTQEQFKSGLNSINAILHEANQKIHVIVDANRANCLDGHYRAITPACPDNCESWQYGVFSGHNT